MNNYICEPGLYLGSEFEIYSQESKSFMSNVKPDL